MNLQQLEYIVAVEEYKHFARAAEACFVTQPTLSMMIQKLEEELELKIFDRTKQPVKATTEGAEIILRAKQILAQSRQLKNFAKELKGEISGEIHLGIIPTLAPYLLPLFLKQVSRKFPKLNIFIRELTTEELSLRLKNREIDMALLATPLHQNELEEHVLFNEEFFIYAGNAEKLPNKKYVLPKELRHHHLWLLEEGHCFRSQVINLCELKKQDSISNLHYEAGSIETLINLVDKEDGLTVVPQLATYHLKAGQKAKLREFAKPTPVREISLVTIKDYPRKKILQLLKEEILKAIPFDHTNEKMKVVKI